jgi:cell division control protein 6
MADDFTDSLINTHFKRKDFFINHDVFDPKYRLETIKFRDDQQKELMNGFSPLLRGQKARNVFCFGKTGKTLTTNYLLSKLKEAIEQKNKVETKKIKEMLHYTFNCKISGETLTPYQLLQNILKKLGVNIPAGHSTKNLYNFFFEHFKDIDKNVVLVFDELDSFIKKNSDELLYAILRVHEEYPDVKATFSIVGISNRSDLSSLISPKNKTMLSPITVTFFPYNAMQLKEILEEREELGLKKGCCDEEVIPRCSARGAQDNGDARKTIGYLKFCVELSVSEGYDKVSSKLIDKAVREAELDELFASIKGLPKQEQAVLYSILMKNRKKKGTVHGKPQIVYEPASVNSIYEYYIEFVKTVSISNSLSLRRTREIIASFDDEDGSGLVTSRINHQGIRGREKLVSFDYPKDIRKKVFEVLELDLHIDLTNYE